jgi:hypothetical protein
MGVSRPGPRAVWRLRVAMDAKYPGLIDECAAAMEAIFPAKHAHRYLRPSSGCVDVSMYSRLWMYLFPQHAPGKKHQRSISLAPWQQHIVDTSPQQLLRGLIHSDGCRIVARERQANRIRYAPRYLFTNLSDDIRRLFCDTCDAFGVRWTRPDKKTVAVYRLDSVARLDDFIGPKY